MPRNDYLYICIVPETGSVQSTHQDWSIWVTGSLARFLLLLLLIMQTTRILHSLPLRIVTVIWPSHPKWCKNENFFFQALLEQSPVRMNWMRAPWRRRSRSKRRRRKVNLLHAPLYHASTSERGEACISTWLPVCDCRSVESWETFDTLTQWCSTPRTYSLYSSSFQKTFSSVSSTP